MSFLSSPVGKLVAAAALTLAAFGVSAQKTQLTVYTALETDQLKAYQTAFQKANPDIEITWVRDSTGIITAKLLAEKANPKADVIMGVAATSMAVCPSCPHPCIFPLILDAHGWPDSSVRFKASISARSPIALPAWSPHGR